MAWFLLIFGSIVSLPTGRGQQLCAQSLGNASSFAQPSAKWDRYTLKDGELSVLLPVVPAMTTHTTSFWDPSSKSQQERLIGAYAEGVAYGILVFEVRQSLADFISDSGQIPAAAGTHDITVSGNRGKEYAFEDDAIKGVTQFFLRGKHVYVFKALGSRLGNPDVGMPRFFESIKFDRPSVGIVIVDGPGVQEVNDLTSVPDGILTGKQVTTKAVVVTKPEPAYTEEARQKKIIGTVVLRAVFTASGALTNLRVMVGLPQGLSERAVAAARQIRFIPAIKDGHFVNTYIQLEYNFNLY